MQNMRRSLRTNERRPEDAEVDGAQEGRAAASDFGAAGTSGNGASRRDDRHLEALRTDRRSQENRTCGAELSGRRQSSVRVSTAGGEA